YAIRADHSLSRARERVAEGRVRELVSPGRTSSFVARGSKPRAHQPRPFDQSTKVIVIPSGVEESSLSLPSAQSTKSLDSSSASVRDDGEVWALLSLGMTGLGNISPPGLAGLMRCLHGSFTDVRC